MVTNSDYYAVLTGNSAAYGTYITRPPISFTFTSDETSFQWIVDPSLEKCVCRQWKAIL